MPLANKGVCSGLGCDKPKGHLGISEAYGCDKVGCDELGCAGLCISEGIAIGNKRVSRSIQHFIAAPSYRVKRDEQDEDSKPKKSKVATSKANREKQELIYTVEQILDHRPCPKDVNHQKFQYLVKWKSYGASHNSWEPENSFLDKSLLDMYWAYVKAQAS